MRLITDWLKVVFFVCVFFFCFFFCVCVCLFFVCFFFCVCVFCVFLFCFFGVFLFCFFGGGEAREHSGVLTSPSTAYDQIKSNKNVYL